MYKVFYSIIIIFWVLDISDIWFMNVFDTTIPINTVIWLLIFIFLPDVYKEEV